MQQYHYKAKDDLGKTKKGFVEAKDEHQAARILRDKGLLTVSLKPKQGSFFDRFSNLFGRVSNNDKVSFTRQLSTMINAGLQLTDALNMLEAQSKPALAEIVGDVAREVESGNSLAASFKKHPQVFDKIYVAMVQAGESAGVLDKVMNRLADNLEKEKEFRAKIKNALLYPAIVILGMIGVMGLMIVFVIPKMVTIYESFGAQLPITTKILIFISDMATSYWWLSLLLLIGLVWLGKTLMKTPGVKEYFDEFMFKVPIVGGLRKKILLTEFSRTLGLLIGAGILIVDALEVVRESVTSPLYNRAVKKCTKDVQRGIPLATAMVKSEVFPPIVSQMAAVGEETGRMDEVLLKISSYFEQEADYAVKNLTTALEPIIMIVLGIGVAFLMISVIMPIYNLTGQF